MTQPPPDLPIKPCFTLRRGSDRERRTIRLCWLLGWPASTIAAHLGCHLSTVRRRMRAFDLCGAEQPGEREHLVQAAMRDRLADDLLMGGDVMKLGPQIAKLVPAAPTAVPSSLTERVDTYDNDDLNGDWRDWAARLSGGPGPLDALAPGLETKSAGDHCGRWPQRAQPAPAGNPLHTSVPARRPAYTGTTTGRLAHMVVHGGARRGQDTGGR